ncbi:MAG: TolC family protein [Acidobacteria bacterium]|nr:TolC family protein [Acidobacteriota bacterium]
MRNLSRVVFFAAILWLEAPHLALAQAPLAPPHAAEKLTLQRTVALALQNSRELALARIRHSAAVNAAGVSRAQFRPNLFTGTGSAYTNGFPLLSGGAPSVFNLSYVQTLFNSPLRGQLRAAEERAGSQNLEIERTRDTIIVRTASAYLELAKARHALELLRRERESALRIVEITRERLAAGLELPLEVTRAQLSAARIEQRIARYEGQEDALAGDLRNLTGIVTDGPLNVETETLPLPPEQPIGDLVTLALENSPELKQAEAERRAREHRLKGERGGYFPTIDAVVDYRVLGRFNDYDQFFNKFVRNNVSAGLRINIPIFSAKTAASVALARSEFSAAEQELKLKRAALELDIRRQARSTRELDAAREVSRLEVQLARDSLATLQAQFNEGRASLRDLEKARLEEGDKWMAFLDADFALQKAQLELLRATGQLARLFP